MSVAHIQNSGSRASGVSTPDNWEADNCYPPASIATALGVLADGDSLVFDDQSIAANNLSLNGAVADATLTLASRTGETTLTLVDATTRMILHNSGTTHSYIIDGLILDGQSITFTATGTSIIQITQAVQDLIVRNCTFANFVDGCIAARTVSYILRYAPNTTGPTVLVKDNVFDTVSATTAGDYVGLFKSEGDEVWTIEGNTFKDVSLVLTAGNELGIVYHTGAADVFLKDNVLLGFLASTVTTKSIGGFYRPAGAAGNVYVDGLFIDGFVQDGLASSESVLKIISTGRVRNVYAKNVQRTGTVTANGNSTGGVVLSSGASAVVTVDDMVVTGGGGFFGTAIYNSGGGEITARRIKAGNIDDGGQVGQGGDPVNGQAFYSGGDGDSTWEAVVGYNCTGDALNGLVAYGHLPASGATDKAIIIHHSTFANTPSSPTQPACDFRCDLAGKTLTMNVRNTIFDNGEYEMLLVEGAGTFDFTLTSCHITEGTDAVSASISAGTLTLGTPTTGDPKFKSVATDDYRLDGDSPCIAAGTRYWTGEAPHGQDGLRFFNTPSIGAYEDRSGAGFARKGGARVTNTLPAGVDISLAKAA